MINLLHQVNDTSYKSPIIGICMRSLEGWVINHEFLTKTSIANLLLYNMWKETSDLLAWSQPPGFYRFSCQHITKAQVGYLHSPSQYSSIPVIQGSSLFSRGIHLPLDPLLPIGTYLAPACILPRTCSLEHVAQKSSNLQPLWMAQRPRILPPVWQGACSALRPRTSSQHQENLFQVCWIYHRGTTFQKRDRKPGIKIVSPNSRKKESSS